MMLSRTFTLLLPMALAAGCAFAEPAGFTDNLDEALAKAKAEGKLVYVCFSGSDWCGGCKRLEKEVFSDPLFAAGAMDDYVLVFIDSPRDKSVLTERAKKKNPKLVKEYGIDRYPAALILDGDGNMVRRTGKMAGYSGGGAAAYVKYLMELKKPATDSPYVVETPVSTKLVFDTTIAPDLRKWTEEKLAPLMSEWVVKLADIMASDGWEPPKELLFQFVGKPMPPDGRVVAGTLGNRIALWDLWLRENRDGWALGTTIHELTHAMQDYWTVGGSMDYCPSWVSEGYADYIRYFLYEPDRISSSVRKIIPNCRYNDSYSATAFFFGFVESRYPGTMKKLNAAMRNHTFYDSKFWKDATGKTAKELEADWKSDVSGAATTPKVEDFKAGETGFRKGGAKPYAEHLLDIKKKR